MSSSTAQIKEHLASLDITILDTTSNHHTPGGYHERRRPASV